VQWDASLAIAVFLKGWLARRRAMLITGYVARPNNSLKPTPNRGRSTKKIGCVSGATHERSSYNRREPARAFGAA